MPEVMAPSPITATTSKFWPFRSRAVAMPSAAEFPTFEVAHTETPSPLNPLGAKGIGESATVGSTPAVQNAVVDALSHLGVRHIDLPCTPERVWRAIEDARAGTLPDPWREPPAAFATLTVRPRDVATHSEADDIVVRFVPTPEDIVDEMSKLAKIGKEDVVYDLGCGDAVMLVRPIMKFGAKKGVGIEYDAEVMKLAIANVKKNKLEDKVVIRQGDMLKMKADEMADATVVLLYIGDDLGETRAGFGGARGRRDAQERPEQRLQRAPDRPAVEGARAVLG